MDKNVLLPLCNRLEAAIDAKDGKLAAEITEEIENVFQNDKQDKSFDVEDLLCYLTSSNIKYIDNQLVTVIKIQMICKCKYKTI